MQQAHSNSSVDGDGSNNTNSATLVRKGDARPHDVLMGRGHFVHPGNDRFLQIVSERRADYCAACYADKQRIATEVLERVLDPTYLGGRPSSGDAGGGPTSLPPLPARFLQLESGDTRTDDCMFRFASGKAVDAKVKMALRQKKRQDMKKRANDQRVGTKGSFSARDNGGRAFDEHAKTAATAHENLDPTSSNADLLDDDVLFSRLMQFSEGDGSARSAQKAIKDVSAPEESAPSASMHTSAGRNGPSTSGGSTTSLASDRISMQQLLPFLRAAQETVQPLREKYHGVSSSSQICSDLHALGKVLHRMLAIEHGDGSTSSSTVNPRAEDDSEEPFAKRERRREEIGGGRQAGEGGLVPLQDLGYPTSISIFVQSLIDATDEDAPDRFQSICDVDNDLQLMIEYPDKYLFDPPHDTSTGKLAVSSELYGVQMQQNKLMNAFQSVIVTGKERRGLVLISGQSGTGKTSLVNTLCGPLSQQRGKMVQVKFDKKDNQSMTSIFRAFNQYCYELQGDLGLLAEVGDAVKTALGTASNMLRTQMPNLWALVGDSSPLPSIEKENKHHRLLLCLQEFIRAISAPSHPIVIFFDDLQWTDVESLDLITKIVKDAETSSCLFVGCYRDNEVWADHPLPERLANITLAGVPMWQIFQEGMDKDALNEFLSETLHLLPRITAPLAREIYKKTGGNPNFAKQLLQSFCDERLLQYSPSARRWQWDTSTIRAKNVPDGAVSFLLERMTEYGPDVQQVLQVAALMGRRFDALALKTFQAGGNGGGDGSSILAHVDAIVDDGLVCIDKAELRFAHDSIWEAATSLTPAAERKALHLIIGRQMLRAIRHGSEETLDVHLQLIVDQMNCGSTLIQSHEERLRLAKLNLQVGRLAIESCSFVEASLYLLQGCALLSDEDWEESYNLCLEIFSSCAEAQLAHGNNDGALIAANAVILHGRSLHDRLEAHFIIYIALYTQGKIQDACQKALGVLEDLGIRLPPLSSRIESGTIRAELINTEKLILPIRSVDLMTRPISATNSSTLGVAMRFLFGLCQIFYVTKPDFFPLVVFRMVQITMERPMTKEASFAFAAYSNLLCKEGLRDRSAACAQTALALLDKFHGAYSQSLGLALAISIWPYRQPWRACLDSFERTTRDAKSVGDVSVVLLCHSHISSMHHFVPANTLQDATEKLIECQRNLKSCGHPNFFMPTIYLQMTLNLTTSTLNDPTNLHGDATDQNDILSILPQSNMFYSRLVRKVDFARLYLSYVFRKHDVVLEVASHVKDHLLDSGSDVYPSFELLLETFYLALAAYSIMRFHGKAELWQTTGDKLMNEMKALSENDSKWNFQQKYLLLKAEKAFTDGNLEVAAASYDRAIEAAKDHRFINEEALANECASVFHLEQGNIGQARKYLEQSKDLYQAWGAHRKVEDILPLLSSMQ